MCLSNVYQRKAESCRVVEETSRKIRVCSLVGPVLLAKTLENSLKLSLGFKVESPSRLENPRLFGAP